MMQKDKPKMTLRFGASHNSLTIAENGRETFVDFNKMTRDHKRMVRNMTVEAWCLINGVPNEPWKPKKHRRTPKGQGGHYHAKQRKKKAVNGRRKAEVRSHYHAEGQSKLSVA